MSKKKKKIKTITSLIIFLYYLNIISNKIRKKRKERENLFLTKIMVYPLFLTEFRKLSARPPQPHSINA
jgi:hypothetical protein